MPTHSFDNDAPQVRIKKERNKALAEARQLKSQLRDMLSKPLMMRGVSAKYLTGRNTVGLIDQLVTGTGMPMVSSRSHESCDSLNSLQVTLNCSEWRPRLLSTTSQSRHRILSRSERRRRWRSSRRRQSRRKRLRLDAFAVDSSHLAMSFLDTQRAPDEA